MNCPKCVSSTNLVKALIPMATECVLEALRGRSLPRWRTGAQRTKETPPSLPPPPHPELFTRATLKSLLQGTRTAALDLPRLLSC